MVDRSFFEESRAQSAVKARIASKYFDAWGRVMVPSARRHGGRIAYIDLFCGPGRYEDGTRSTPILVLEKAIAHPDLRGMVVALFNDHDEDNVQALRQAIDEIPGIGTLKNPPRIYEHEVDAEIAKSLQESHLVPTFSFIDPWGYKGLSLPLIRGFIKDWGCDTLFFFNYNRINMAITNEALAVHIDALFGGERAASLRGSVGSLDSEQREELLLRELTNAVREQGGKFVLTFRFRDKDGKVSHHLVFVTKSRKGYDIMKEIMAGESLISLEGVPSFEFSEAPPKLFYEAATLGDLRRGLLATFAGRRLTMIEVFDEHNVGTPYIKKNYKQVLLDLESEGVIEAQPPRAKRRRGFGDGVLVRFPKEK